MWVAEQVPSSVAQPPVIAPLIRPLSFQRHARSVQKTIELPHRKEMIKKRKKKFLKRKEIFLQVSRVCGALTGRPGLGVHQRESRERVIRNGYSSLEFGMSLTWIEKIASSRNGCSEKTKFSETLIKLISVFPEMLGSL